MEKLLNYRRDPLMTICRQVYDTVLEHGLRGVLVHRDCIQHGHMPLIPKTHEVPLRLPFLFIQPDL
jgi:hypothetical protein